MSAALKGLLLMSLVAALALAAAQFLLPSPEIEDGRPGAVSPGAVSHGKRVAVSVKPLHSLVAAVMEGDDTPPALIAEGAVSPHLFSLRPSSAAVLEKAEIVFYIGGYYDAFLRGALQNLPKQAVALDMSRTPGLTTGRQDSGADAGQDHIEGGAPDLHYWLSPVNARALTRRIAEALSERYPERRALYLANAARADKELAALDEEIKRTLVPAKNADFVVMHDAYRTFTTAYGLRRPMPLTSARYHGLTPGRMREVSQFMAEHRVGCVFADAGLPASAAVRMAAAAGVRTAPLDPDGALLAPGPRLYPELMRGLAASFSACASSVSEK